MLKKKKNIISIKVDIMTKYQCLRIRKKSYHLIFNACIKTRSSTS